MAARTLDQLRRDQQELLQQLQSGSLASGAMPGAASEERARIRIARITQVVATDETYGPHLMVKPQTFSGRPPTASDTAAPARRAYPTPNRAVGDYTVDEHVVLAAARGVEFALKLS